MTYIVGLTGGIGSGKSTIANYFAEMGAPIIDADVVARDVVAKNTPLFTQIVAHFGPQVLTEQGELNRTQLRQIIFHDEKEKQWLNQLLHPAIRHEMLLQLKQVNYPYAIWVVPLLIENQLTEFCDRVLIVDVLPEIQLERAMQRDNSNETTIRNIMQAQVSREERLHYADDIVENNLPLAESASRLYQQIQQLHQHYLILGKNK